MKGRSSYIKEKTVSIAGGISGFASVLGSWQVCHSVCMWIIAILSIIGITVIGMPLAFLTTVAVPFWIAAVVLFAVTLFFYLRKACISSKLIMFNGGILIAGIPFQILQQLQIYFWSIGGALVLMSLVLYIKDRLK